MRLVQVSPSPAVHISGGVRLTADIELETRAATLRYWFELPSQRLGPASERGDAWAVLMLPLAVYFGERLVLDRPLDPVLRANLDRLQAIWCGWYPQLRRITIEAPDGPAGAPAPHVLSCMSGGVDSLFTAVRHADAPPYGDGGAPIDQFLSVGGFNIREDRLAPWFAAMERTAGLFGRPLVAVATNARFGAQPVDTPYLLDWWSDHLAHGATLAAIAHLLGDGVGTFLIPASDDWANLSPWGSHPETDPLFSSSRLRVVHEGTDYPRIERLARVAQSPEALRALQVCFYRPAGGNCGRCEKCLNTMMLLDLLGARESALSFDWSAYSPPTLSRIFILVPDEDPVYEGLARLAQERGRPDLARCIASSLAYSRRRRRLLAAVDAAPGLGWIWRRTLPLRQRLRGRR